MNQVVGSEPGSLRDRPGVPAEPPEAPSSQTPAAAPATLEPAADEALDLGAIGTKAVGRAGLRALRSPIVWVIAAALAGLVWMFVN